ncbi:MAG: alpha-amylase family glycosyl hydrolase [Planctomycetota bacterium]|jgi:hypothetical protein|nr:alpha-amylase family glycosyl hydrolase [Planctomycetota bacterium]
MGTGAVLTIRNQAMTVRVDPQTGSWIDVRATDGTPLLGRAGPIVEVVLSAEAPDVAWRGLEAAVHEDEASLTMAFTSGALRLDVAMQLDRDWGPLAITASVTAFEDVPGRLLALHHHMPGMQAGPVDECLLQAPGQYLAPGTPYQAQAALALADTTAEPLPPYPEGWLEPCPDQTSGLVAVEHRASGRVVSAWQHSRHATSFPTLDGRDGLIDVCFRYQGGAWLRAGTRVSSDGMHVLASNGGLDAHLALFRDCAYRDAMRAPNDSPSWFTGGRLLQIMPSVQGIAHWAAQLPRLVGLGFTVLYLTPVWACQDGNIYALSEHYAINPQVGTVAEVRAFVDRAHELGLKVLFDFIPQGLGDQSRLAAEHPAWLVGDAQGRPFGSHGWGPKPGELPNGHTLSLDWGQAEVQEFMLEWAGWNVDTFDIDGFRTDALHWKEPNFSPTRSQPAWLTMFGGVRLGERLRDEMRVLKSDFALLGEVWGPLFAPAHDAVYANSWLAKRLNAGWLRGEPVLTAAQWQDWCALDRASRPKGAMRANFTGNHDSRPLLRQAAASPWRDALSVMYVFMPGLPFVFESELEGRDEFWRAALAERACLAGFVPLDETIAATSVMVWSQVWRSGSERRVVLVNLGDAVVIHSEPAIHGQLRWGQGITLDGQDVRIARAGWGVVTISDS